MRYLVTAENCDEMMTIASEKTDREFKQIVGELKGDFRAEVTRLNIDADEELVDLIADALDADLDANNGRAASRWVHFLS